MQNRTVCVWIYLQYKFLHNFPLIDVGINSSRDNEEVKCGKKITVNVRNLTKFKKWHPS